jgi:hypothetical protein
VGATRVADLIGNSSVTRSDRTHPAASDIAVDRDD